MKKAIAVLFLASLAAAAGPLKVATYPVVHFPKAEVSAAKFAGKATMAVTKGVFAAVKAVLW